MHWEALHTPLRLNASNARQGIKTWEMLWVH